MTLNEQFLLWLILVGIVMLVLLPNLRRSALLRMRPQQRRSSAVPPTSDGLPMPQSQALARAEIVARNAHTYSIHDIPANLDRLTLFRRYWEFRGEAVAGTYLYPGVRSYDDCVGRSAAAPYYPHKLSIWSWGGDSASEAGNAALKVEIKARFDRMLTLLEQNGWQSVSHDDETTLLHLYRSA